MLLPAAVCAPEEDKRDPAALTVAELSQLAVDLANSAGHIRPAALVSLRIAGNLTAVRQELEQRLLQVRLPGEHEQAGTARRRLSSFLALAGVDAACTDDAVLVLSELATNAMCHTRSRLAGGMFTVRAEVEASHVHVEVTDEGGPWLELKLRRERGLGLVGALSQEWGIYGSGEGRTVWAVIARDREETPV